MKKLNIITIAILTSFSLSAQEPVKSESSSNIFDEFQEIKNVFSENEEDKIDEAKKMSVVNEGKVRSRLRQKHALAELENEYLASDIERLNQQIEQRRLKYLLSLPIEDQLEDDSVFEEEDEDVFDVSPNQHLPELKDQSQSFKEYDFETYDIDQMVAKEPKKIEVVEEVLIPIVKPVDDDNITVDNGSLEVVEANADLVLDDSLNDSGIDPSILEELGIDESELLDLSQQAEEGQSVIENESMSDDALDFVVSPDEIERAMPIQYADITNIEVNKIVIFKDKKFADLSLDIYVGDGVNGATNKKTVTALKEMDIIKYKGFEFKVVKISKKEIELQDVQNDRIYIATPSVNSI